MFERLRRLRGATKGAPLSAEEFDRLVADADRLRTAGLVEPARVHYRKAHEADASRLYPLYWLATLAQDAGDLVAARRYCEIALAQDSAQPGLLMRLASICTAQADDVVALECYERVAALDPDAGVEANLADGYCRLGRVAEGIAAFDRARLRNPGDAVLAHNRLFVMNFSDELAPEDVFARHREWAADCEQRIGPVTPPRTAPGPKLIVGYVSPDLRDHAVAHFIEPLLRKHDRSRFEIHCFDTSHDSEDTTTLRLRQMHVHWHRVSHLDDDQLAAYVRAANVDVLVDLAGHTKGGRLEMFARRPAPVQVTWLGYLGSTGLHALDYRLTDAHMDPEGETEHLHTEALVRLPVHACFEPWKDAPPPTIAASDRPLTYGSVNQWPKVSASSRAVWAEILAADPRARLFVVVRGGHRPRTQASSSRRIHAPWRTRGSGPGIPVSTNYGDFSVSSRISTWGWTRFRTAAAQRRCNACGWVYRS